MIKRTIDIAQQPVHLTTRDQQLLLLARDAEPRRLPAQPPNLLASIPCEDIGVLLVDQPATTYSHAALARLLEHDAAVVICGRDHLPAGLLLPIGEHSQVVWRLRDQLAAPKPLRKRLWQQLIRAKIRAQAANLPSGHATRTRLLAMAREVRSGDPDNCEAQAARSYWSAWYQDASDDPRHGFRRAPDGDGVNALLNYGYAVVRAAVARAIVAAGLLPAIGIKHRHRANAFCLADDLVEPLRPFVDRVVADLVRAGTLEIGPQTKPALLGILTLEVACGGQSGPLMVALHRYAASLVACFERTARRLAIPTPAGPADAPEADETPCI